MREETVVTIRICFPTSSKFSQNLVKFWMKFVTGRRHQPQQENVSGDSFTCFLPRVGQRKNRFGKVWTGLSKDGKGEKRFYMLSHGLWGHDRSYGSQSMKV